MKLALFLGIFLLMAGYTANPLLTFTALAGLPVIFKLTWKDNIPVIFPFAFTLQWLQVSVKVYQANINAVTVREFTGFIHSETAILLGQAGIIIMALVLWWRLKDLESYNNRFREFLHTVNLRAVFFVYLGYLMVATVLSRLPMGGFAQVVNAFLIFKWVFYLLLATAVLEKRKHYLYIVIAFSVEFISGLISYFSSFKEVIFFTVMGLMMVSRTIKLKQLIWVVPSAYLVFNIFIIWTGIKSEYREFLSQGEFSQTVNVSAQESLLKLGDLVVNFSEEKFMESQNKGLNRLAYSDMLATTMEHVPAMVPHEKGKISLEAVEHILLPRFLFPDKKVLDDSEVANKYSGRNFYGKDKGTSVSLGYFAELYVDWGRNFIFLPLICIIWFFTIIVKSIARKAEKVPYWMLLVCCIFFEFKLHEKTLNKLLGAVIMSYMVYRFIYLPYIHPVIMRWIVKPDPGAQVLGDELTEEESDARPAY